MWKRVSRLVRAEVEHARRSITDRLRRSRSEERYDSPAPPGAPPATVDAGAPPDEVRRAFAALELPLTAGADEVRHAWRVLVSRYHPDRHATDPERERAATELTRRLTEAHDRALDWLARQAGKRPPSVR
ncbi:MAG: J domain-containing protein [Deltaproteobacteria bacterium]|nr:J domain-containing protein [Deltaproteobacteria bacterium]